MRELTPSSPMRCAVSDEGRPRATPWACLAAVVVFALATIATWGRVANVRVDCGSTLDRAARVAAGEVLYRDVQSPYGPVADYALAMAFRVFGTHLSTALGFASALLAAESVLLWVVCRWIAGPIECATGLVVFWLLAGFQPGVMQWVLPNTYSAPVGAVFATLALALVLADLDRPSGLRLGAASMAAAVAGLAKIEFGAVALAVLLARVAWHPRETRPLGQLLALALGPGALVVSAAVALVLLDVPWRVLVFDNLFRVRSLKLTVGRYVTARDASAWPSLWRAAIEYLGILPAWVVAVGAAFTRARRAWPAAAGWSWFLLAGLVLAWALSPWYWATSDVDPLTYLRSSQLRWSLVGWTAAAAVALVRDPRGLRTDTRTFVLIAVFSVVAAARFGFVVVWPQYYAPFAPALVLLVVGAVSGRIAGRAAVVAPLVVTMAFVPSAFVVWKVYRSLDFVLDYPRGRLHVPAWQGADMAAVIDWLRANTAPAETVSVIPEERMINFLADRRNPTRDSGIGPGWLATEADQRGFVAELIAANTRAVVVSQRRYAEFGTGDVERYAPLVVEWIRTRCRPATQTTWYVVYDCLRS